MIALFIITVLPQLSVPAFAQPLLELEPKTLNVGTGRVKALVFSGDGSRLLAFAENDQSQTAVLWDTANWAPLRTLSLAEHASDPRFTPDASKIAVRIPHGKGLLDLPSGVIHPAEFDNPLVAYFGELPRANATLDFRKYIDGVGVWDLDREDYVLLHGEHSGSVHDAQLSHDHSMVVTVGQYGEAIVWDVSSRNVVKKVHEESGHLTRATLSPDNRLLAAGTSTGQVRIWRIAYDAGELQELSERLNRRAQAVEGGGTEKAEDRFRLNLNLILPLP